MRPAAGPGGFVHRLIGISSALPARVGWDEHHAAMLAIKRTVGLPDETPPFGPSKNCRIVRPKPAGGSAAVGYRGPKIAEMRL
jgi:hypothetical protein